MFVVQLNGKQASQSMQQLMELLLERIVETNLLVAVVDLTNIPTLDTQTAQYFIHCVSAIRRLGIRVILTGVRPSIDRNLVHLDADLSGITTCSSLVAGLWTALDILELESVNKENRQEYSSIVGNIGLANECGSTVNER